MQVSNHSSKMLYDRWRKPGDIASIPRYDIPIQFDDRLLEDASFAFKELDCFL